MTRIQQIRHECLLQLYASGRIPLSVEHIRRVAKQTQFDYTETELRDQLYFLKGQGFLEEVPSEATGQVLYRITSAGMLEYERNH